jgi:hypothetical protein
MEFLSSDGEQQLPKATERVATSNRTKRYLVAAGLIAGGVTLGAIFSPIGLAGAQSNGTDPSTTVPGSSTSGNGSTTAPAPNGGKPAGKPGRPDMRRGFGLDQLATTTGIPAADLRSGFQAGKTLLQIAQDHNISEDTLVQKLGDAEKARLDEAVKNNRLTQQQEDQRLAAADARIKAMINAAPGHGGGPVRPGVGPGLGLLRGDLANLASALGIDGAKLRTDIAGGKTLAEAAAAQNVSADKLRTAITDAASKRIDQTVTNGHIDQATADKMKANLDPFVDAILNWKGGLPGVAKGPGDMGRGGHMPGGGWGRGPGGPANNSSGNNSNGNGSPGSDGTGSGSGSSGTGSGETHQSSYTA